MSNKIKITPGFITQEFDKNGNLLSQEFVAGDDVAYEDGLGDQIDPDETLYAPYDMAQPSEPSSLLGRDANILVRQEVQDWDADELDNPQSFVLEVRKNEIGQLDITMEPKDAGEANEFGLEILIEVDKGVPAVAMGNSLGGDNVLRAHVTEDGVVCVDNDTNKGFTMGQRATKVIDPSYKPERQKVIKRFDQGFDTKDVIEAAPFDITWDTAQEILKESGEVFKDKWDNDACQGEGLQAVVEDICGSAYFEVSDGSDGGEDLREIAEKLGVIQVTPPHNVILKTFSEIKEDGLDPKSVLFFFLQTKDLGAEAVADACKNYTLDTESTLDDFISECLSNSLDMER